MTAELSGNRQHSQEASAQMSPSVVLLWLTRGQQTQPLSADMWVQPLEPICFRESTEMLLTQDKEVDFLQANRGAWTPTFCILGVHSRRDEIPIIPRLRTQFWNPGFIQSVTYTQAVEQVWCMGTDREGMIIYVGCCSPPVLPVFFPPEIVEELKNSSCRDVLEKYDSFSTKVSLETTVP